MEKYVLEALCKINADSLALVRMKNRYAAMVNANYTTLWEVWTGLADGTINHGWNAPNTVLSQYIAGVSPTAAGWSNYSVLSQMANLTAINEVVPSIKGNITVSDSLSANQFVMNLVSPSATKAIVGIPKKHAWQSVTANSQLVWNQGAFHTGVAGVSGAGEDSLYIKFNVDPGSWRFVASLTSVAVRNPSQYQTDFGVLPVQVRLSSQGLEIVAGTNEKYSVNIFDCAEHHVVGLLHQQGGITRIPRRFLNGRVYIVRVASDKNIVTRKIVVAH
jgi:hypothetical protein